MEVTKNWMTTYIKNPDDFPDIFDRITEEDMYTINSLATKWMLVEIQHNYSLDLEADPKNNLLNYILYTKDKERMIAKMSIDLSTNEIIDG